MNYFKYLFALVLSAGMISSTFALNCKSGVYSGVKRMHMADSDWRFPFEFEIGSKDDQIIFLATRTDGEREQLCTLYTSPEVEFRNDFYIVTPSSFPRSTGSVGSTSAIRYLVIGLSTFCERITFEAVERMTMREFWLEGQLGVRAVSHARKIEGREARSFDELKRVCGF